MISVDHNHTIGLMQSQEQKLMPSSPVLPDTNSHQRKLLSSSSSSAQVRIKFLYNLIFFLMRKDYNLNQIAFPMSFETQPSKETFLSFSSVQIRLAVRCSCPIDDKHEKLFDEIFSNTEQTTNISDCILNECLLRLTNNYLNTLIILTGYYREGISNDFKYKKSSYGNLFSLVHQIQTDVLSSTIIRLFNFCQEQNLILHIHIQDLLTNKTCTYLILTLLYMKQSFSFFIQYLQIIISSLLLLKQLII